MTQLTPAQREVALLHAAVLEAASKNMKWVAEHAGNDPVLRGVDAKTMQTLGDAALILSMSYQRAINGALEIEA